MPAYQYPNCCGVMNLVGFGPGGTRYYTEKSEKWMDNYLAEEVEVRKSRAMLTLVIKDTQEDKFKKVLKKHGFVRACHGYNSYGRGNGLVLYVRSMNPEKR